MKILLVGANRITAELAKRLAQHEHEVSLIGTDKTMCDKILTETDIEVIVGDYTDIDFLEQNIDIKGRDVIVVATGSDEINLLVSILMKCLGAKKILTIASDSRIARALRSVGIEVLEYATTIASLLEAMIEGKRMTVDMVEAVGTEYKLISYMVSEDDKFVGKKLSELKVPTDIKILAVFDGNELRTDLENIVLKPGTVLLILARREHVKHIRELLESTVS